MLILIPVDSNDKESASLVMTDEAKYWALLELNEGKVQKIDFYEDRHKIEDFVDVVILASKNDYCWQFIEEDIPILIAPFQRSIDDIVEAFLFKELHELNG